MFPFQGSKFKVFFSTQSTIISHLHNNDLNINNVLAECDSMDS